MTTTLTTSDAAVASASVAPLNPARIRKVLATTSRIWGLDAPAAAFPPTFSPEGAAEALQALRDSLAWRPELPPARERACAFGFRMAS